MRVFRIYLSYFMVFFCALFLANATYMGNYIAMTMFVLLSLFWLRQFWKAYKFHELHKEFEDIMAEAKRRVDSGAPARELLEMAKDRLNRMMDY